jgi:hypothetical protein
VDAAYCAQLTAEYTTSLNAAAACTPGALHQCETLATNTPTYCPNTCDSRYVNAYPTGTVWQDWENACDPGHPGSCGPTARCIPAVPHANCVPTTPGASTGTCVPYGPDAGAEIVPDGGESCGQLAADYAAAISAAQACTPGAPNQCEVQFPSTLIPCNGACATMAFVNGLADAAQAISETWSNQCGPSCGSDVCTRFVPSSAVCVPVDGGTGTCVPQPYGQGTPCDQLLADYASAVRAALPCTPGAPNQCQVRVGLTPWTVGCADSLSQAVNDASGPNAAAQKWAASCGPASSPCNSPQPPPSPGVCNPVGSASPTGGICVNALTNIPAAN